MLNKLGFDLNEKVAHPTNDGKMSSVGIFVLCCAMHTQIENGIDKSTRNIVVFDITQSRYIIRERERIIKDHIVGEFVK